MEGKQRKEKAWLNVSKIPRDVMFSERVHACTSIGSGLESVPAREG